MHGPIRKALSITTSSYGALPIYVVFIYFRAPRRHFVSHLNDGDAVQVDNPDAPGIFLAVTGDLGMFITTYHPAKGETAEQFTRNAAPSCWVKAIGEPIEMRITEVATWQPYEQVADEFACGRVFVVGDSAHTMPPFKAGGANSAIQSAHNLAWKLATVPQRQRISTLDLLGHEFALLTGDQRWRGAADSVSTALGVPIAVQCIRDNAWFAATGLKPHGALLVRPDDFVGWRCSGFPADPSSELRQALSRILCR